MPCSAYTLSLATIAAVISVALLAIAFSTDNWSRITVERIKLEVRRKLENRVSGTLSLSLHGPRELERRHMASSLAGRWHLGRAPTSERAKQSRDKQRRRVFHPSTA